MKLYLNFKLNFKVIETMGYLRNFPISTPARMVYWIGSGPERKVKTNAFSVRWGPINISDLMAACTGTGTQQHDGCLRNLFHQLLRVSRVIFGPESGLWVIIRKKFLVLCAVVSGRCRRPPRPIARFVLGLFGSCKQNTVTPIGVCLATTN